MFTSCYATRRSSRTEFADQGGPFWAWRLVDGSLSLREVDVEAVRPGNRGAHRGIASSTTTMAGGNATVKHATGVLADRGFSVLVVSVGEAARRGCDCYRGSPFALSWLRCGQRPRLGLALYVDESEGKIFAVRARYAIRSPFSDQLVTSAPTVFGISSLWPLASKPTKTRTPSANGDYEYVAPDKA